MEDVLRPYNFPRFQQYLNLPPENPTEMIAEVDPTFRHSEYSIAVAGLFRGEDGKPGGSEEHFHPEGSEFFRVLEGQVRIYRRRSLSQVPTEQVLRKGESIAIDKMVLHRAEPVGDFAAVFVASNPGWTRENHQPASAFPKRR